MIRRMGQTGLTEQTGQIEQMRPIGLIRRNGRKIEQDVLRDFIYNYLNKHPSTTHFDAVALKREAYKQILHISENSIIFAIYNKKMQFTYSELSLLL